MIWRLFGAKTLQRLDAGQEIHRCFHCRVAFEHGQHFAGPKAGGQQNGIILFFQIGYLVRRDFYAAANLHAKIANTPYLPGNHGVWQAIFRDSITQIAARLLLFFKNCDGIAKTGKSGRSLEAGRPAADNGHAQAIGFAGFQNFHVRRGFKIRGIALNAAYINGPVNAAARAAFLTIFFRWADAGADCAKGVVFPYSFSRAPDIAKTDASDKFARICSRRTVLRAWRVMAQQTARRFFHDGCRRISRRFIVIVGTHKCSSTLS